MKKTAENEFIEFVNQASTRIASVCIAVKKEVIEWPQEGSGHWWAVENRGEGDRPLYTPLKEFSSEEEANQWLSENGGDGVSQTAAIDVEDSTDIIRQDIEDMMDRNPGMDPENVLRIVKDNNPDMSEQELTEIMDSVRTGSRRTAEDEAKDKTVTPATGPKGNVATNDTMKDDTFYGDDKVLHDQLDKHEKRASVLNREAMLKLKMADNYEKAANMKMAKEMDKQATILYTEWKKTMATIAGMKKEMASQRRITAAAIAPKLFFQNRETEDKNNPFS